MRTFISMATCVALTACVTGPAAGPEEFETGGTTGDETAGDETAGEQPTGAGEPVVHELTLPARYSSSQSLVIFAEPEGDRATALTELSYGLMAGYPRQVEFVADGGYMVTDGCALNLGDVVWWAISEVKGDAAKFTLEGGALGVELLAEGEASVLLTGELMDQDCVMNEQSALQPMPLQHLVRVKAREVAGFEVRQFHQQLTGCAEALVLPSDAPLWVPTAWPVDADGQVFEAINAPAPVAITLRSPGALAASTDGQFTAGPGVVDVGVEAELPARGLESFTVVGPDALTGVEATLHLQRAAAKGGISDPIVTGATYPIHFPEMINTVDVRVAAATTELGGLCGNVPRGWFAVTSSTPAQCVGWVDETVGSLAVARIEAAGECSLEVSMPGTEFVWATNFVTEF